MTTKLRDKRHEHKLLQIDIAKRASISLRAYQYYERGERSPDVKTAKKIAKVFDCQIEDIF